MDEIPAMSQEDQADLFLSVTRVVISAALFEMVKTGSTPHMVRALPCQPGVEVDGSAYLTDQQALLYSGEDLIGIMFAEYEALEYTVRICRNRRPSTGYSTRFVKPIDALMAWRRR